MGLQLVYFALVGICPDWWPFPWPGPRPPWWGSILIGAVGGIVGGLVVSQGLGMEDIIATSVGAFAGGKLSHGVVGGIRGKGQAV